MGYSEELFGNDAFRLGNKRLHNLLAMRLSATKRTLRLPLHTVYTLLSGLAGDLVGATQSAAVLRYGCHAFGKCGLNRYAYSVHKVIKGIFGSCNVRPRI